jgi:hypothetical protein
VAVLWADHRALWRTVGVSDSALVARSAAQVAEVWAALQGPDGVLAAHARPA